MSVRYLYPTSDNYPTLQNIRVRARATARTSLGKWLSLGKHRVSAGAKDMRRQYYVSDIKYGYPTLDTYIEYIGVILP